VEVPCFEDARIHGVSNLHAIRDGWCVLRMILRERFSGEPHRATGHRASGDSDLVGQPSE
jgi:hypothetical protein